jgi:signal peptidase I
VTACPGAARVSGTSASGYREDVPETEARPAPRAWWRRVLGSTWFHLAAAFIVTGLVLSFVAKPYWVPSGSMETTLQPGDRVMVNRLAYVGASPGTGDVVVFDAGSQWDIQPPAPSDPIRGVLRWLGEVTGFGPSSPHTLIKRVIGTPGQTVECCTDDGRLIVDGEPLDEPYVTNDLTFAAGSFDCATTPRSPRCFEPVEVPADSFLMLGDNRGNSSDSAAFCRGDEPVSDCWRWATRSDVVGKAVVLFWPITRWSGL